jgi:hypothetical protein
MAKNHVFSGLFKALQRITRKREVGERRQLPIFSTVAFSANALQSPFSRQVAT